MRDCATCGSSVADEFRFCPWCAAPQRAKIVEFFRAHPLIDGDAGKALRVSRYLAERHVRISIWREGEATAAVSLDEHEADRLGRFLSTPTPRPGRLGLRRRARSAR